MAISDQLTLLNNTKTAIRTAINNKGGSVTDSTPFADYSTAIDNLPSGGDNSTLIDLIERDITSITIPSGTTTIGVNAFNNCRSLTSVTMPNGVTTIGQAAFSQCTNLVSITLPSTVTLIYLSAFEECKFTNFVIPSGVTTIYTRTFYNCSNLANITIPNTVTTIGSGAFYGCMALKNVIIPNSVASIDGGAFDQCRHLESLVFLPTTPPTLDKYSTPFNTTNNCPIYVPAESVDAYKAASRWTLVSSRIYPIQQVATVDGNPVYNYDLGMTSTDTITSDNMAKMPAGTSLELAEGITWAGGATAFSNYTNLTLPSTFATFGDQNMLDGLTTVTSKATTPPSAERNQIGGSSLTAIYVPAASVDTYKAAGGWSNYASIIQAIQVPAKLTITFEDDSTYVVPSDGSTTINNDDLLNAITDAITDSGATVPSVKIEIGDMITELEDLYIDDDPNDTYYAGTFENISFSELVLPASLTAMGENTFVNGSVSSSGSITFYAVTPPTFTGELPGTQRRHVTVYVPAESVEAYQTAWSKYASWIQAIPTE